MKISFWSICCFIFFFTGCAPLPPKTVSPTPIIIVHADNEILAYALNYGTLSAEEQRKEFALVMQAFNKDKTNMTNRMKAALALSLPASRQRDNARALSLLDEIQRDSDADPDTKAISALLKEYVSERQKLEENAAKLGAKHNEDLKRLEAMQLKADGLQQKADALQQKLDDLKNIEKAMTNRDQVKQK